MSRTRALIFSSVRDTSGNVVLEAMGLGVPVICFKHQGGEMMTDDHCAIRISPSDWPQCVHGFSSAIVKLAGDDRMVDAMGRAGRTRAVERFTWETKISDMLDVYSRVQGNSPVTHRHSE
jgi:glycosyltransferase involved in cell wall biosynthesis